MNNPPIQTGIVYLRALRRPYSPTSCVESSPFGGSWIPATTTVDARMRESLFSRFCRSLRSTGAPTSSSPQVSGLPGDGREVDELEEIYDSEMVIWQYRYTVYTNIYTNNVFLLSVLNNNKAY